jgi:hypothetical protein
MVHRGNAKSTSDHLANREGVEAKITAPSLLVEVVQHLLRWIATALLHKCSTVRRRFVALCEDKCFSFCELNEVRALAPGITSRAQR